MNNFKIEGKSYPSTKSHYVVLREHEKKTEHELHRLEDKLKKHEHLPMDKPHPEAK